MATFNECVLTNKGIALLAKVQDEQCKLVLTKAATGDGSYVDGEDLASKTALKSQKQEFSFSSKAVQNSSTLYLKFVITNNPEGGMPLATGYYIKEIGIFATDPDDGEILYAIATAVTDQWDYMPAYNGAMPATNTVEMFTEVSNAEEVTLEASQTLYALEEDLEETIERVEDIETNIGTFETDNTAARAHAVGDYFVWKGQLVRTTTAIASGGTIICAPDTGYNVRSTSISLVLDKSPSAMAFNRRIDRNWDGLGSLVASATDITADFDNGKLSAAIAANDLSDYDCGQQIIKTISIGGTNYTAHIILAHANAFYGYSSYAMVDTKNIGCVVYVEGFTSMWNASNTDGGYASSLLRTAIQSVVNAVKTVLGDSHMVAHQVLLSNAVSSGKSSNWAWAASSYGEAMSVAQMFGTEISGSYFDTGEAYEQLALFKEVRPNQVYGNVAIWNRDVLTASVAAGLDSGGRLYDGGVTASLGVSPLILLK